MSNVMIGILIPFFGTTLGAACVFLMRGETMPPLVQKLLLGFASGVMVAASVWSLLIPAMDMSAEMGRLAFIPAAAGVAVGMLFLLLLDKRVPHQHMDHREPEGPKSSWRRSTMLVMAVTLHNIPEGMAVGVVFAGLLADNAQISLMGAFALSIGIAIQNFPEGAIISMPLRSEGGAGRGRAFLYGTLSGVVEPAAALVTILLSELLTPVLPLLLAFAAGAMLYVVVEELIPEAHLGEHSNVGTLGFIAGFVVMMILDVALG